MMLLSEALHRDKKLASFVKPRHTNLGIVDEALAVNRTPGGITTFRSCAGGMYVIKASEGALHAVHHVLEYPELHTLEF